MRKFISIVVLLLVGVTTYGQNYNYPVGLYSYGSLTTLDNIAVDSISTTSYSEQLKTIDVVQRTQNYNYPVGLYNYNSLSTVKVKGQDAEFVKKAKSKKQLYADNLKIQNEKSRKNIVIRRAKTEVLVRYNGKYSSIKLINLKGQEVKANFSKKYRGFIVPRSKEEQKYFLEVKKSKANTYYHQVTL